MLNRRFFSRLIVAVVVACAGSTYSQDIPYQSEEFRDPDGRIPSLFMCMFAGQFTELAPDADKLGLDFLLAAGATPSQVDIWAHDASIYLLQEVHDVDMAEYWYEKCDEAFTWMREYFSE